MDINPDNLGSLNNKNEYDLASTLNNYFNIQNDSFNADIDPFLNFKIMCKYYNESSLMSEFTGCNDFLILNANIQSLPSKFSELKDMLLQLQENNIMFDIIALQEIWSISDPEHFNLPGYQTLIYKTRSMSRGGGVGFYVRQGLNFKILEDLSIFNEKIFESICIQVEVKVGKKINFISLYRPPGNHPTLTPSNQLESFLESYEDLLSRLSNTESFIYTDSNIDLFTLNKCASTRRFFELSLCHGFLNIITKASRFSAHNHSEKN